MVSLAGSKGSESMGLCFFFLSTQKVGISNVDSYDSLIMVVDTYLYVILRQSYSR